MADTDKNRSAQNAADRPELAGPLDQADEVENAAGRTVLGGMGTEGAPVEGFPVAHDAQRRGAPDAASQTPEPVPDDIDEAEPGNIGAESPSGGGVGNARDTVERGGA